MKNKNKSTAIEALRNELVSELKKQELYLSQSLDMDVIPEHTSYYETVKDAYLKLKEARENIKDFDKIFNYNSSTETYSMINS